MTKESNPGENANRAVKVDRLLRVIDDKATKLGEPITSAAADLWNDDVWLALAVQAECTPPSEMTRRCVITVLRDRELHPDPFAAFGMLSNGCTGERYPVNPGAPEHEGFDIVHDTACPVHPDAGPRVGENRERFYGGRR